MKNLVWLLLFLPIFIHSTDPQSSPEQFKPEWYPEDAPSFPEDPTAGPPSSVPVTDRPKPVKDPPSSDSNVPVVTKEVPAAASKKAEEESAAAVSSGGDSECLPEKVDVRTDSEKTEDILRNENYEPEHEVESQIPATPSQMEGTEKIPDGDLSLMELTNDAPLTDSQAETEMPGSSSEGEKTDERKEDEDNKTSTKTEEIPSFSEWTKLQLLKKKDPTLLQHNGIVREGKKEDGKNFASPDCGAKILLANPEAQNPSGLLSTSHDEYMLNRCTVSSWIIMELCEPIRIEKISMGNLELFSSSPKEVEVGVSDRYPTREWVKIGPLELPDSRAVHSFAVGGNSSYSKFVRVQILSHHGNEHYCPLSAIRIYGKSEYEVLQEVTHSDDDSPVDHPESPLDEGTTISDGANDRSVIGTAADAVINIVKKAVNVLGKRDNNQDLQNKSNSCQSVTGCLPTQAAQLNITEVCNWKVLSFVQENSRFFTKELDCHKMLRNNSIGAPGTVEGFWRAVFGDGILLTACNYDTPLKNCTDPEPAALPEAVVAEYDNTSISPESNVTTQVPISYPPPKQVLDNSQIPTESNGSGEKPPPVVVEEEAKTVQKESVFVRLTNRIKNLERNQSLSSGYLEELSQRFKKQSEESYSISQSLKKSLNETLGKYKWLQEFSRRESSYLRRSMGDLRVTLWRTEMQRGFLIFVAFVQFLGIGLFCCWTRRRISELEAKITSHPKTQPAKPVLTDRRESQQILPRKRCNSHPDLLKTKKKKKKKENSLKNAENIFAFIPHSATMPNLGVKPMSVSNGALTPTNQNSISTAVDYPQINSPSSMNRFGILASPSVTTINSGASGVSSTSTTDTANPKLDVPQTNGNRSGGSVGSLDSGGSSAKSKGKKMKLKHFIPKLFEK